MSKNDDYTRRTLVDFSNQSQYHKTIGTDLSRQNNTSIPQQINFEENLEEDGSKMFFNAEKQ